MEAVVGKGLYPLPKATLLYSAVQLALVRVTGDKMRSVIFHLPDSDNLKALSVGLSGEFKYLERFSIMKNLVRSHSLLLRFAGTDGEANRAQALVGQSDGEPVVRGMRNTQTTDMPADIQAYQGE